MLIAASAQAELSIVDVDANLVKPAHRRVVVPSEQISFCHSEPGWKPGEEPAFRRANSRFPSTPLRAGSRAIKPRFGMTTFKLTHYSQRSWILSAISVAAVAIFAVRKGREVPAKIPK